jgi:hypothetical protein
MSGKANIIAVLEGMLCPPQNNNTNNFLKQSKATAIGPTPSPDWTRPRREPALSFVAIQSGDLWETASYVTLGLSGVAGVWLTLL